MKAAVKFVEGLGETVSQVHRLQATLFGSLAWTGKGHATDKAIVLGFSGHQVDRLEQGPAQDAYDQVLNSGQLKLPGGEAIEFLVERDVTFDFDQVMPRHPNAMAFEAFDHTGLRVKHEVWFSLGGGFIEREGEAPAPVEPGGKVQFSYLTMDELLCIGRVRKMSVADIVLANETVDVPEWAVIRSIDNIINVMLACIDSGLRASGTLPGGLGVARRASQLFEKLELQRQSNIQNPAGALNYVSAFAIAVNEENAAGGRVVTAPTNGAAGVVPAVLRYYSDFCDASSDDGMRKFILTAAAIGGIIKRNASISGAEVGCQGEVGSAAAMAAAGLAAALGATNEQIENAAEIALEHHLGMTCDPVGGLVQIPCIERNAFGALKAINAANLSLLGDGRHRVSLDQVIETMRQTGADLSEKYRETSRGGLAVNVPTC
jgi:L-serine dehydratase